MPVTDQADTIRPIPAGPSARGTTKVHINVISQVTTCPPARAVTFLPRRGADSAVIACALDRMLVFVKGLVPGEEQELGGFVRSVSVVGIYSNQGSGLLSSYARASPRRVPSGRAGTPPTMVSGATSRVTTAPAAITAPRPIVTPGMTIAPAPIHTWSWIVTGRVSTGNCGS